MDLHKAHVCFRLLLRWSLEYESYTDYYYGGASVNTGCILNECNLHTNTCATGGPTCLPGWEGVDCNTATSGGLADCSVDTGQSEKTIINIAFVELNHNRYIAFVRFDCNRYIAFVRFDYNHYCF